MQYFRNDDFRSAGEGGKGEGGNGVQFFLEDICDIVFGLFTCNTKMKQHMISTESIDSIT